MRFLLVRSIKFPTRKTSSVKLIRTFSINFAPASALTARRPTRSQIPPLCFENASHGKSCVWEQDATFWYTLSGLGMSNPWDAPRAMSCWANPRPLVKSRSASAMAAAWAAPAAARPERPRRPPRPWRCCPGGGHRIKRYPVARHDSKYHQR